MIPGTVVATLPNHAQYWHLYNSRCNLFTILVTKSSSLYLFFIYFYSFFFFRKVMHPLLIKLGEDVVKKHEFCIYGCFSHLKLSSVFYFTVQYLIYALFCAINPIHMTSARNHGYPHQKDHLTIETPDKAKKLDALQHGKQA